MCFFLFAEDIGKKESLQAKEKKDSVEKTVQVDAVEPKIVAVEQVKSSEKLDANGNTEGKTVIEEADNKSITTKADVHNSAEVQEAAATLSPTEESEAKAADAMQPSTDTQTSHDDGKVANGKKPIDSSAAQEPPSIQSNATASTSEMVANQGGEAKPATKADAGHDESNAKNAPTPAAQSTEAKPDANTDADAKDEMSAKESDKTTEKDDSKKANGDASKSFQVLPSENRQSDNLNQEIDDTGNLALPKPPTETIRKTSFTVLKSDESIDDLLAGMDENRNKEANTEAGDKPRTRPKSFKVLKSRDASGEDIILHQSSDQEAGGTGRFEDYLNKNLAHYGGKYSDSELMKSDGPFNGRRKKYKKRAKSVKQLTIVDGPNKDQDSGFEPSPRTMHSQKIMSTRAIYTATLPERPRVGDIIDGRSASSQQRKLGDKNAVNMTTVSQTLQRNIRR